MKDISRLGVAGLALALFLLSSPTVALCADGPPEKILVLKNGRRIRGEIVAEDKGSYTIKSSGGKTVIARDQVVGVEDVPPPKPFLEPVQPSPEPTPSPEASRPAVPAATPSPTAAAPTPTLPVTSARPTRGQIEAALKALEAIPPAPPPTLEDEFEREKQTKAREAAIESVKKQVPLGHIVAVMAEPTRDAEAVVAHGIAVALVDAAGAEARPHLATEIASFDTSTLHPSVDVLAAVGKIGDDANGTIEQALDAKILERVKAKVTPVDFLPPLEKLGTRRSLAVLCSLILTDEQYLAGNYERTCRAILARDPAPEKALAPLLSLDPAKLPSLASLPSVLSLLAWEKDAALDTLRKVLDALDRTGHQDASEEIVAVYRAGFGAVARIGSPDARRLLANQITMGARPILAIDSIGGLPRLDKASKDDLDLLDSVVSWMSAGGRDPDELASAARTLRQWTGQNTGADPAAWQRYLKSLGGR